MSTGQELPSVGDAREEPKEDTFMEEEGEEKDSFVLEEAELSASEDEIAYEEVPVEESSESEDEDFETVLREIKTGTVGTEEAPKEEKPATADKPKEVKEEHQEDEPWVEEKAVVVDDFIRNFLVRAGMTATLDAFETEWYALRTTGKLSHLISSSVPNAYLRFDALSGKLHTMEQELTKYKAMAERATAAMQKLRKARDHHRLRHRQTHQRNQKLTTDMRRLQAHYKKYEPIIRKLRKKYQDTLKQKTLTGLDRDKLAAKVEALESQLVGAGTTPADPQRRRGRKQEAKGAEEVKEKERTLGGAETGKQNTSFPPSNRMNPYCATKFDPVPVEGFQLAKTFQGHSMSISGLALHPKKSVLATTSDDMTWKLWSLPSGELVMSGEGHKDWIGGCDFHPNGSLLATVSGDRTVKVWDFRKGKCSLTFSDHSQAVWDVCFHDMGDFVASASMDHSARLWDLRAEKSRQVFREHVDSVNSVCFQPFSNNLCTASGDKTVSLWDIRSSLCVQTFYGHNNAINAANFSLQGDSIVSVDLDGVIKVWDVRKIQERLHIETHPTLRYPASDVCFDRSGHVIVCGTDTGVVKVYSADTGKFQRDLEGHSDAVQSVVLDPRGQFMVTAGSDMTFRLWTP